MDKQKFVRYEVDDEVGIIKWEKYVPYSEVEFGEIIISKETFIEAYKKWIEPEFAHNEWERKLP